MSLSLTYEKLMSTMLEDPQAKLISMIYFRDFLEVRKETVLFGAATLINGVIAFLFNYNRRLFCSLGIIGTSTHGQDIYQPRYSGILKSL
jgi:hypothetical protein